LTIWSRNNDINDALHSVVLPIIRRYTKNNQIISRLSGKAFDIRSQKNTSDVTITNEQVKCCFMQNYQCNFRRGVLFSSSQYIIL